jgi:hypothetical protein
MKRGIVHTPNLTPYLRYCQIAKLLTNHQVSDKEPTLY